MNQLTRRGFLTLTAALALNACGSSSQPSTSAAPTTAAPTTAAPASARTLKIGAIPDAAPEKLVEINTTMAAYLSKAVGIPVEYVPVNDYAAAVSLFRTGDLDVVWFGGLTGVQARLQTPGATLLAQRDVDDDFHSVFIVNTRAGIGPLPSVADLAKLRGLRFTFGSESSTSGRLMPEFFLDQAGIDPLKDFSGQPGFSGSHDKTVDLVQAGTFQAGALNEEVWKRRVAAGTADPTKVAEVLRSPGYRDYHWIAGPQTDTRFGSGFGQKLRAALLTADTDATGAKALALLGAKRFIPTDAANYAQIESIGRKLEMIS